MHTLGIYKHFYTAFEKNKLKFLPETKPYLDLKNVYNMFSYRAQCKSTSFGGDANAAGFEQRHGAA
jgi:hypothetical protein